MKKIILFSVVFCLVSISGVTQETKSNDTCVNDTEKLQVSDEFFYIEKANYKNYCNVLGRVLFYSYSNDKQPAILFIIYKEDELPYIDLMKKLIEYHGLNLNLFIQLEYPTGD